MTDHRVLVPADTAGSLIRVALGEEPPDTLVANATVFDATTGEFLPDRSIWIKDGRIARVVSSTEPPAGFAGSGSRGAGGLGGVAGGGPGDADASRPAVIDASGLTLVPGLIDGHSHLIDIFIPEFIRALLPTGVTSVVLESMEYGATHGSAGIRPFIAALRDQPLRLFYTAPTLSALTEEEEVAPLTPAQLGRLLADPLCLGLGEAYWSNALLPGRQGSRVRDLVAQTLAAGKVVEGHTAGARGARLDAYVALGVSSCHEPISVDEALEVYRRGLLVMVRHGGIRRDLEALRPLFDMSLDFRRFALVTDSVDPERLATWGYLDQVVREALELDIPPHVVYRMASTNVAEHFRIDHLLGSLAAGRSADMVAIPSPGEFQPVFVMAGGRLIFDRGTVLAAPRAALIPPALLRTVNVDADRILTLAGPPPLPPANGSVRVIEHVTNLVTRETVLTAAEAQTAELVPVLAVRRTGGEQAFWGFLKGLGLRDGAYATTTTWDSPDLVVVGRDEQSVLTALRRVVANGGGRVFARGADVVAESVAPICGVASLEPIERVRTGLRDVKRALESSGVAWTDPLLTVDTLTTPAIPHLRLTHRGYVRLKDRALLTLEE